MPLDSAIDSTTTISTADMQNRKPSSPSILPLDKMTQPGRRAAKTPIGGSACDPTGPITRDRVVTLESSKLVNTGPLENHHDMNDSHREPTLPMEALLAQFRDHHIHSERRGKPAFHERPNDDGNGQVEHQTTSCSADSDPGADQTSNSVPATPADEADHYTLLANRPSSATANEHQPGPIEVERLKMQLAQAQSQITRLDQELTQTRSVNNGSDAGTIGATKVLLQGAGEGAWLPQGGSLGDTSEDACSQTFSRTRDIWGNNKGSHAPSTFGNTIYQSQPHTAPWLEAGRPFVPSSGQGQHFPIFDGYRNRGIGPQEDMFIQNGGVRHGPRFAGVSNPSPTYGNTLAGLPANAQPYQAANGHLSPGVMHGVNSGQATPLSTAMYSQQFGPDAMGTNLSPYASEFESRAIVRNEGAVTEVPTYLPPTEPLNYRRLLDRNVNCNWKYIVDKIVCNNDQQASIFLQQKLKVGTPEQKYEIVEAIVAQAYPLMINRFGNFLVQRCFEHGTPEQVIKIAEAIHGHTLNLSMDPFGCHVVQKAFDSVPEEYKAIMVHELLRRIPETVIHRYACHVWQKLFELRWTESPPQIMKYVNEALRGMWHEVALGETGSLVVQNIFENCLEEDKRPCIEEVLANIDIVAHGQFGNWCIQHICEHGGPPDRSRAIDHVIRYAAEYSTDQFASKVVEKCLKIGGTEFLGHYLDRVCEGRRDRTRIPLIDIASDQYGNYLIQWILNNASSQHREVVAAHIRKHMVSLRGSKFGSRVGMLCTNHAVTTRPGPGAGPGMSGRMGPGPRFGPGAYR